MYIVIIKTKLYVMKPDYETVNNAKEQIKKVQDKKNQSIYEK